MGCRKKWVQVGMWLALVGTPNAGISIQPPVGKETQQQRTTLSAASSPSPARDSLDRDYADELPRIAPVEPEEALRLFVTAAGFHVELVAAEPLVVDPVAMCFDEDGRLYVVEMRDYSEDDKLHLGRIRLLDDTDGDGRFDRSVVFADHLSWPTAVICFQGGVFVGAAPEILYLKDTDGDGRADHREVVFTGFSRSNVQGMLNSFLWGLDNRIWGSASTNGGQIMRPDRPDEPPVVLRGRDFAFDPRTRRLEPTTGGGQHGMSFNRWGDRFVCSNSDHVQMIVIEDRYVARNPFAAPPAVRRSIAVDGPQADVYRVSPVEPWRIVRTRLRVQGLVPGPVEGGGRPAGYFTSATGITIYQGDAWPATPYEVAIVGDVGGNLVHRKRLVPDGVLYRAERIDEKSEFVASKDIWFRPVQFAHGPDGTLYVLDMYREVIEHPASLPPIIKRHLDLTSGRDRGRIYRIVPEGYRARPTAKLSSATTEQLVQLLDHPNGWHRTTAARLLWERQDHSAVRTLEQLVQQAGRPEGRVAALWALHGLQALSARVLLQAMDDPHPQVRRHAARLSESLLTTDVALRTKLATLVDDPEPVVYYQAALSLGEGTGDIRDEALARLAVRAGTDPYIRFAIHSAVVEGAAGLLERLVLDADRAGTAGGQAVIAALAAQIGRQQAPGDVAALLRIVPQLQDPHIARLIVSSLGVPADSPLARRLAEVTQGRSSHLIEELVTEAAQTVLDGEQTVERRIRALPQLSLAPWTRVREVLTAALAPDQPQAIQIAVVETLRKWNDAEVADVLVSRWSEMAPSVRQRAADVFVARSAWAHRLLTAVEEGTIPVADISPSHWQALQSQSDPHLRERSQALASVRQTDRQAVLEAYREALERTGDPTRGRQVFAKNCASCHQIGTVGHAIGPSLAAMRNRGKEAVLTNVLAPNAEVNPQYLNYVVVTKDGRTLNGIIAEESASSITLVRAENARDQVLRVDIDSLRSTGQSLMPEGVERDIDVQAMADLLEFLMTVEMP